LPYRHNSSEKTARLEVDCPGGYSCPFVAAVAFVDRIADLLFDNGKSAWGIGL